MRGCLLLGVVFGPSYYLSIPRRRLTAARLLAVSFDYARMHLCSLPTQLTVSLQ